MQDFTKVISSDITRGQKPLQNNLYDLISVTPATPINVRSIREHVCGFQPNTNKVYVPKRRKAISRVKTVRDIRKLFENDVYPDLSKEIEKQQNYLLKKITCGSSRENTKSIAKNILKCDKPVSRTSWQMLMNLNPHGHAHAIQYVLWNGRRIRVNGSRGGKSKFLCNYDLGKSKVLPKKEQKILTKKRGLLRNSLSIKFKPGPLARKMKLDESYQKYNVGNIKLVHLPPPGLDIQPKYGVQLEPTITNLLHSLRDVDGFISEKWAEFSVSVLGGLKDNEPVQNCEESAVSFELNYKYDQNRILMRHDIDTSVGKTSYNTEHPDFHQNGNFIAEKEIENILDKIIDAVEISLKQDNIYTGDDEPREPSIEKPISKPKDNILIKEKAKKRYSELDRLDVTVIRLPEAPEEDRNILCSKSFCALGCICASLQCSYSLKQHCGRLDCMFECKCDFSKYRAMDSFESDCPELIPGLINLDNELSSKLAKEEQKFHQTVVLTGEKSVVLKSERRNWKASKRYGNFYNKMCLKGESKPRGMLSIVDIKLNLENVEPWCMVHNLYKCFCKGKFLENIENKTEIKESDKLDELMSDKYENNEDIKDDSCAERKSTDRSKLKSKAVPDLINVLDLRLIDPDADELGTCARAQPYGGRKFNEPYYFTVNARICEMEQNDKQLQKRLMSLIGIPEGESTKSVFKSIDSNGQASTIATNDNNVKPDKSSTEVSSRSVDSFAINDESSTLDTLTGSIEYSLNQNRDTIVASPSNVVDKDNITSDKSILSRSGNKTKLIAWLEASYKQYKKRLEQGIVKKSLEPPKHGKVALYPWEFILTRYRERKNLFLISKEKPFRMFMAVDAKHSFFANCINIDDIRFAELSKYPATVKNLLTNATDIKDNFCILCGLSLCWELIGSVTKLDEPRTLINNETLNNETLNNETLNSETLNSETPKLCQEPEDQKPVKQKSQIKRKRSSKSFKIIKQKPSVSHEESNISPESESNTADSPESLNESDESLRKCVANPDNIWQEEEEPVIKPSSEISKWFVMTVENDFTEIQFFRRGFFVKYESIIKAINVARMSEKTVRLSSQKCSDTSLGPQFGIYAIPNANEYCVFVGPYDKDEPLGIETVKLMSKIGKTKSTRGVWITVKKVDNTKLIDNPLTFLPVKETDPSKIVTLDNSQTVDNHLDENKTDALDKETSITSPRKDPVKVVKPIKIRKADGFYQLTQPGIIRPIAPNPVVISGSNLPNSILQPIFVKNMETESHVLKTVTKVPALIPYRPSMSSGLHNSNEYIVQNTKPVAEIAPQIKIVDVYSEKNMTPKPKPVTNTKPECVLILKPEEINQRLVEKRLPILKSADNVADMHADNLDPDIEKFLATSSVCLPPNADIYEISDEEYSEKDTQDNITPWKEVWIECKNIEQLGYIRARKNNDNKISFEFPGFKFTEFYSEEEAFSKINQVLSRKIYVPKRIELNWQVVDSVEALKGKEELRDEHLGSDFVLTKQGLRHKKLLMASLRKRQVLPTSTAVHSRCTSNMTSEELDKAIDIIIDMDDQSKNLDEEGDDLLNEMATVRDIFSMGQSSSQSFPATMLGQEHQATLRHLSEFMSDD